MPHLAFIWACDAGRVKRVLALVGLLAVGLLLLLEPDSGAVAVLEATTQPAAIATTSTTAPPDPTSGDPMTTHSTAPDATTTQESTTATTTEVRTAASGTFVGEAVNTRFGEFQVQIIVDNGVMTDIVTLDEPGDNRSIRINRSAIPIYTEQALELQSSDFDAISGATITWQAWGASLASAVEIAGIT